MLLESVFALDLVNGDTVLTLLLGTGLKFRV